MQNSYCTYSDKIKSTWETHYFGSQKGPEYNLSYLNAAVSQEIMLGSAEKLSFSA